MLSKLFLCTNTKTIITYILALLKPIEYNDISPIIAKSGTIIATVRNNTFKLSGSSCLPAYL